MDSLVRQKWRVPSGLKTSYQGILKEEFQTIIVISAFEQT